MRLLVYGDIGGSGGYHRYCKGLFGNGSLPSGVEVWFVCSPEFYEAIAPLDPQVHVVAHPWPGSTSRAERYLWHVAVYPGIVRRIRPDLEFYPAGRRRIFLRKALSVTTCHNLLLFDREELEHIEDSQELQALETYRNTQARSFQQSDATIFLSDHSRLIVCREAPMIRDSTVIPHGIDEGSRVRQQRSYELDDPVNLLYVSPIYHYKHQVEVVRAVRILRERTARDIRLRLIGGGSASALRRFETFVESQNAASYVSRAGVVAHKNLLKEHKAADICVFASSCECFPNTLIEAMAARLPIACSDRVGLPVILKDAGVYFDPEQPESIVSALHELIGDMELRKRCGERAYRYSLEYSWQRCASETVAFLKQVAGQ